MAKLKDFRFHDLRHAAASVAYEATRDTKAVQLLLHHSRIQTTDRYVHVSSTAPHLGAANAVSDAVLGALGVDAKDFADRVYKKSDDGDHSDTGAA